MITRLRLPQDLDTIVWELHQAAITTSHQAQYTAYLMELGEYLGIKHPNEEDTKRVTPLYREHIEEAVNAFLRKKKGEEERDKPNDAQVGFSSSAVGFAISLVKGMVIPAVLFGAAAVYFKLNPGIPNNVDYKAGKPYNDFIRSLFEDRKKLLNESLQRQKRKLKRSLKSYLT